MFGAQDLLLKRGTNIQANHVEREANIASTQECQNLVGNGINLSTRRRDRFRKGGFDSKFGRNSRFGEQNPSDLWMTLID
jgi:hypothetical protein